MKKLLFKLKSLFSEAVLHAALQPTNHEIFICNNLG
jgi:hypothetical protein